MSAVEVVDLDFVCVLAGLVVRYVRACWVCGCQMQAG